MDDLEARIRQLEHGHADVDKRLSVQEVKITSVCQKLLNAATKAEMQPYKAVVAALCASAGLALIGALLNQVLR